MAEQIHHIERVKLTVSFYVARPYQIRLVDVVKIQCLSEIGILDTLGNIRGFF
jgi:hypothetical protein